MNKSRTLALTLLLSIALLFAFAAPSFAGPPGTWSVVTGQQPNTAEVGLARTADGRLHVLWPQEQGLGGTANDTAISANARTVGAPSPVFTYSDGLNSRMALVAVPGGLRAFFSGLVGSESNPLQGRLATATSTDGSAWSVQPDSASNNTTSLSSVYAASGIAAAMRLDGTAATAWGDTGAGFHFGLASTDPDQRYSSGCCVYAPGIGVDSVTGETVLAYKYLLSTNGTAYQTIWPSVGAMQQPPGANNADTGTKAAITGRIGAPGVYLAYLAGDNQFLSVPSVVRTGSTSVIRFRSGKDAQHLGIAAAPSGRIWLFWLKGGKITAVRSNPSVTRFGAPATITPPRGATVTYNLAGNAELGPLDLIALVAKGSDLRQWHQRIEPGLTLSYTSARGKIKFKVTDAGTPVRGARVRAGGRSGRTNAHGKVTIRLRAGSYRSKATKTGYHAASVRARAR